MVETGACRNLWVPVYPKGVGKLSSINYRNSLVFRSPKHICGSGTLKHRRVRVIGNVQETPTLINGFKPKEKEFIERPNDYSWTALKDSDRFNWFGRLVEGGLIYRQSFVIRSYEVGADMKGSIDTILNLLQEAAVTHAYVGGLCEDGFGSTREMSRLNLIWVITRMQIEVEHYPSWGDVAEIDTWIAPSGKNSVRRDWLLRDLKTGYILASATSSWVMMNKETRRLVKFPEAVRKEICSLFLERSVFPESDVIKKLEKLAGDTAQHTVSDLTPKHRDLDTNGHVNNVKYVGWVLESVPVSILEKYELASMTLEYRRECGEAQVLQSLTTLDVEKDCLGMHLLQLQESGLEVLKGTTEWRAKLPFN